MRISSDFIGILNESKVWIYRKVQVFIDFANVVEWNSIRTKYIRNVDRFVIA